MRSWEQQKSSKHNFSMWLEYRRAYFLLFLSGSKFAKNRADSTLTEHSFSMWLGYEGAYFFHFYVGQNSLNNEQILLLPCTFIVFVKALLYLYVCVFFCTISSSPNPFSILTPQFASPPYCIILNPVCFYTHTKFVHSFSLLEQTLALFWAILHPL